MKIVVDEDYEKQLESYTVPEAWESYKPGVKIWCEIEFTNIAGFGYLVRLLRDKNHPGHIEGSEYLGFRFTQLGIPGNNPYNTTGWIVDMKEYKQKLHEFIDTL